MLQKCINQVYSSIQGQVNWLWQAMQPARLLSLHAVLSGYTVEGHQFVGRRTVAICHIRGSANESRCYDFDARFRPLNDHNNGRWASVAQARQQGKRLPPVSLIQFGETYFVQDGHHRLSVACAAGQEAIEAEVTVLFARCVRCGEMSEQYPVISTQ